MGVMSPDADLGQVRLWGLAEFDERTTGIRWMDERDAVAVCALSRLLIDERHTQGLQSRQLSYQIVNPIREMMQLGALLAEEAM